MNYLQYTFLRTEADNAITLFLAIEPTLRGKELDLQLSRDKKLSLSYSVEENNTIVSKTIFSEEIENILFQHLKYHETKVVFCDLDANILDEQIVQPFNIDKKNRI